MVTYPTACALCPRACGANRAAGAQGYCGASNELVVARAALHYWEEPPISGERGSGAIFLTHCPLRCVYCQNSVIAAGAAGRAIDAARLAEICCELQAQGALNINFVTPTHYAPSIREAVVQARALGLSVPVVWNTSGYETLQAIRENVGTVDIYLTDFKYADAELAGRYSNAPDYPEVALAALEAMVEAVGEPRFDEVDGSLRMIRGVIVRHLLLPGAFENSCEVVRLLHERFGASILLSIMNQYTPVLAQSAQGIGGVSCAEQQRAQAALRRFPELASSVSSEEYERLLDYADSLGVEDYFWQEGPAALESFIPAFDLTGV